MPESRGQDGSSTFTGRPGRGFVLQFGEELCFYDDAQAKPRRVNPGFDFDRLVAREEGLYGRVRDKILVSQDDGLSWREAEKLPGELLRVIEGRKVDAVKAAGHKLFAIGPKQTYLKVAELTFSRRLLFEWLYPLDGIEWVRNPERGADGEFYVAGRTAMEKTVDFIWRFDAQGTYLSGYQFETRGDFARVEYDVEGTVSLVGGELRLRFDRELSRLLD